MAGTDDVKAFFVCDRSSGAKLLQHIVGPKANYDEATSKATGFDADQMYIREESRLGAVWASTDSDLAYIVVLAPDYPDRAAKPLVQKHADQVEAMTNDGTFNPATPNRAQKPYEQICARLAEEYGTPDKVRAIMSEVDMVKGQMNDNINQAMSNLEDATALNSKADEMKAQSNMFNKQAKTAKNQQWWKNMKLNIILAVVLGLIVLSIIGSLIW